MNGRVRAWHTGKEKMYYPEEMAADQLTLMPDGTGFINVSGESPKFSKLMRHMIPMYSTGRYDVDGREVFEGDRIIIMSMTLPKDPEKREKYVKTVEWNEKTCGFNITMSQPNGKGIRVLGNKYEGDIYEKCQGTHMPGH